jgi:hypothetical protein
MTTPSDEGESRALVYGLLITLAVGLNLGRLASLERVHEPSVHKPDGDARARPAWPKVRPEPSPTFGSNDRSRWAAVRALVENGTFVIGRRDESIVLASGPALLAAAEPLGRAVLMEAGYRLRLKSDSGIVFEDGFQTVDKVMDPNTGEFYSTKPPLLTIIAAGEYWVLHRLLGWSIIRDRWLIIPLILMTLNIIPFVVYLSLLAWLAERFGTTDWARYFVVAAGAFATMVTPFLITFNNHTVATAGVVVALYLIVRIVDDAGRRSGLFAVAGLTAGFTACTELPATAFAAGLGVYLLWRWPARTLMFFVPAALVPVAAMLALNMMQFGDWQPAYAKFGGPWYTYEGSHWLPAGQTKPGIDYAGRNGETKPTYASHLLVGHHGWFSLTPVMLLGLVGMVGQLRPAVGERKLFRSFALFSLLVSVVVIGYYIWKTDNYGGWCNGPRWLMWLSPLWLVSMLPVLDRLAASRSGRMFALALLVVSVLSMSYQTWNPWRHPWIFVWMESHGWKGY